MKAKLIEMIGSVRFWFCVAFAVAYYLGKSELLMAEAAKAIELFAAIGVAIRTFDSTIDKLK